MPRPVPASFIPTASLIVAALASIATSQKGREPAVPAWSGAADFEHELVALHAGDSMTEQVHLSVAIPEWDQSNPNGYTSLLEYDQAYDFTGPFLLNVQIVDADGTLLGDASYDQDSPNDTLLIDGILTDCPYPGDCSRDVFVAVELVEGDLNLAWRMFLDVEAATFGAVTEDVRVSIELVE